MARSQSTRITLQHIADEVGVDRSAVSRVLNGKTDRLFISAEKAQRIRDAAGRLGYRPNSFARGVRSGRFGCVAMLLSTERTRSTLPTELRMGVQSALAERELHLMLACLPDEKLTSMGFVPRILRECMADGLLINYTDHIPEPMFQLIGEHCIPTVWLNCKLAADCVHPDDLHAAQWATQRLLAAGHRRIAWLEFNWGNQNADAHYSVRDRQIGYERAVRLADAEPILPSPGPVAIPDRLDFCTRLLARPDRPTAVMCYGDNEVSPTYLAARLLGLSVPRDLSLITFSGREVNVGGVGISTMLVPEYELGRTAVRMLLEKISDPSRQLPPVRMHFELDSPATIAPPSPAEAWHRP